MDDQRKTVSGTNQNFAYVCDSVRKSVSMSICLSVYNFEDKFLFGARAAQS